MTNIVQPQPDGPLKIEGEIEFVDLDGDVIEKRDSAWLCRCGHSANKPYCDGSHKKAGFSDAAQVPADYRPKAAGAEADPFDTRLTVHAKSNGPLRCTGEMEVLDGNGATAWSGTLASFCRCGESKNKPFCDGTHRAIDFEAP